MRSARQSRKASFVEAMASTVVGWGLAFLLQHALFGILGMEISLGESAEIATVFTALSLARSYLLHGMFAHFADKQRTARWKCDARHLLRGPAPIYH